jgi:hypothetical protein
MIYCPSCGTANRDGSRFCNECGTKLPTLTSALCSTCGTPNPPNSLFCEKCGTRLIASLTEEPEAPEALTPAALGPKGLSLPTKLPAEVEPAAAAQSAVEPQKPAEPAQSADEELPEWMQMAQSTVTGTSEMDMGTAAAGSAADQTAPEEVPAWLSDLGPANPSVKTTPGETPPSAPQAQSAAEEMPDWLRDLRPAAGAEESLPDWLDELGVEEQPASGSAAVSTGDSALDWLSQLGATAPEQPSDQGAAPSAETPAWLSGAGEGTQPQESAIAPDWMSSLRAAAPEVDAQPAEEMPDWLREVEAEQPPPMEAAAAGETTDWMSSLRAASIEPEAAAQEEGVPDWLKGAGVAAAGAGSCERRGRRVTARIGRSAEARHRLAFGLAPSHAGDGSRASSSGRNAGMDARGIRCCAGSARRATGLRPGSAGLAA